MSGHHHKHRTFSPLLASVTVLALAACDDVPTLPEFEAAPEFTRGGAGTQGLPISITACGTVIAQSGNYRVDADLVDCPEHGVVIDASHVTLRLDGHTVSYAGSGGGVGLDVRAGSSNVSIHGPGTFEGFPLGGQFEGVTSSRMVDVTFAGSTSLGFAINYDFAETASVRSSGNDFFRNQFVNGAGHGVTMNGGDDNRFRGNLAAGNGGTGFFMFAADGNLWKENEATQNGGFGFWALGGSASGNVIQDNQASGNGFTDADDGGACDNTWASNTFGTTSGPAGCIS